MSSSLKVDPMQTSELRQRFLDYFAAHGHRVVASNGTLGGFSAHGGLEAKRRLLELEAASAAIVRGT